MYIKTIILVLATLFAYCYAGALNPKITSPAGGEQWVAGNKYTITWDTEHVLGGPITDQIGTIKLGYFVNGDEYNEHLEWQLATGFPLKAGSYEVTLPSNLEEKTRYIIVLMGNSGNASKEFTIKPSGGSSSSLKKRTIQKANIKKKISLKKRMN